MGGYSAEIVDIGKKCIEDIHTIQTDVIAKQVDDNFCKWSKLLNAVSVIGLTRKQYIDYWQTHYKHYPEYSKQIRIACEEKLDNGLITPEEMMTMIYKSKDFESEKEKAIKALGGKYSKDKGLVIVKEGN